MPQAIPGTEAGFNTKQNFILGECVQAEIYTKPLGLALVNTDGTNLKFQSV